MKCTISHSKPCAYLLHSCIVLFFTLQLPAQEKRAIKGEMATCQVDIKQAAQKNAPPQTKSYKPLLNQAGYFDRVTNIQPMQKMNIQTVYPRGRAGEKVAIVVLDGGWLDNNEKGKIVQLDKQRAAVFNFQTAADPGIYRILLRKGADTKVVQVWVGPEPVPVKY